MRLAGHSTCCKNSSAVACRDRCLGASFGEELQEMLSEAHVTAILVQLGLSERRHRVHDVLRLGAAATTMA